MNPIFLAIDPLIGFIHDPEKIWIFIYFNIRMWYAANKLPSLLLLNSYNTTSSNIQTAKLGLSMISNKGLKIS